MGNLILISGDIIENSKDMEAIVNPTNKYMDYGSGVCGAIYDKAGAEQLENYCHSKWYNKEMEVNEIRVTTGFALQKDIIHIYAPRYYEEKEPIEKLKESYLNLFEIIKKEKYDSVIIPSLGTGFHCYPHEEVAEVVIKLLVEFCNNNNVKILFNLYDEKTKKIYEQYF
jgi:O-acetyl-ADP-ribose deacetylase (regulator of RNase III)